MALRKTCAILAGHAKKQMRRGFRTPHIAPAMDLTHLMNPRIREQKGADCWATAAVECVEALYMKEMGVRIELSVQHVLDKAPRYIWGGRRPEKQLPFERVGGNTNDAFEFMKNHGVALEQDWPYRKHPINEKGPKIRIDDYLFAHGQKEMLHLLNTNGTPLVARLCVDGSLLDYKKGILGYQNTMHNCEKCQNRKCKNYKKHARCFCERCGHGFGYHSVNLCGYGPGFWKARDSWGPNWGMHGYFQLLRSLEKTEKAPQGILGRKHPVLPYHPPYGVLNVEESATQPTGPITTV